MAAPLTGLGSRPVVPELPPCACGCGRDAPRGFPGGVSYAHACVPSALRNPWEAGYAPPTVSAPPVSPAALGSAAPDLFAGLAPA